ncbi:tRNA (adenosine(37)-N6)-threonylcarbamoyltransferase complex dimerization subunit type 1 TsaB [Sphingomonas sp.]|uniref:tRNA (adenosine(37)-N6)-threonylcarbamoyltransferase complex dimerization subunit type 1 TsaB n=1 Tax=Sphingomonas sp. TaxID=28214 RepID=UPI002EDA8E0C
MRTLVIDTATAACSVALIEDGALVAQAHAVVGRGHAEQLVPMIADLPGGGRADAILVDCGPGSFTGLRVGIAAARGLGLGWNVPVHGYSSLALIAAAGFRARPCEVLAVVVEGGHGEVFMQIFAATLDARTPLVSLRPDAALVARAGIPAIGNGAARLLGVDPDADARNALPNAADVMLLPPALTSLAPTPIYGRAPDAKLPA